MKRRFLLTFFIALGLIGPLLFLSAEDNPLQILVKPAKLTPLKKAAIAWVEANMADLTKLNDEIWQAAEVAMKEYLSAEALASYIEKNGFKV